MDKEAYAFSFAIVDKNGSKPAFKTIVKASKFEDAVGNVRRWIAGEYEVQLSGVAVNN